MRNESDPNNSSQLFSDDWYSELGSSYIKYGPYNIPEIELIQNGDISPFTRFMILFASFNHAEKSVKRLNFHDQLTVVEELATYVQPKHNFSGRLWMELAIQKFILSNLISVQPVPGIVAEQIPQLSNQLDLSKYQVNALWSMILVSRIKQLRAQKKLID